MNTSSLNKKSTHDLVKTKTPTSSRPKTPTSSRPRTPTSSRPKTPTESRPRTPTSSRPKTPTESRPKTPTESRPKTPTESRDKTPTESRDKTPIESRDKTPTSSRPKTPIESRPKTPTSVKATRSIDLMQPITQKLTKKERVALDYASYFPENLILLLSLHGEICVDEKHLEYSKIFDIPDSLEYVSKLNIASLGVSSLISTVDIRDVEEAFKKHDPLKHLEGVYNLTDLTKFDNMVKKLLKNQKYEGQIDKQENVDVLTDFMKTLQILFAKYYKQDFAETYPDYEKEIKSLPKAVNLHYYMNTEIPQPRELDKFLKKEEKHNVFPHLFSQGVQKVMANKKFASSNPVHERPVDPIDYGIIGLNMKAGKKYHNLLPDILASMGKRSRSNYSSLELKTSDIFHFISNIKKADGTPAVKRLLIVDLSCSIFQGEKPEYQRMLTKFTEPFGWGTRKTKRKTKQKTKRKF